MPTFTPPSWEEGINTKQRPLNYFRTTVSASVVRVDGQFVTIRTPSIYQCEAAGAEGTDFFIGGHIYDVADAIADELELAGYPVERGQGFGGGGFGEGGFGE